MTGVALPALPTILPELILALGALAMLMVGAFQGLRSVNLVNGAAFAILVIAALAVAFQPSETVVAFNGSFISDGFGRFMKIVTLTGAAATLALAIDDMAAARQKRFEFAILILLSSLGMLLMISANDLIALYVGLELSSLSLYVLAAIDRDNAKASEAGLKYFVLGALSSGMLLYGASLIYGFTGTVSFAGIAAFLKAGSGTGLIFGLVFLMAGLAFKISAVPFHMWTPDVYEGAPTIVTTFMSVATKAAAFAAVGRVFVATLPSLEAQWYVPLALIAVLSMSIGNVVAITQSNLKRLLAYSGIAHAGFIFLGILPGTTDGLAASLFYIAAYAAMNFGAFAVVTALDAKGEHADDLSYWTGLFYRRPFLATTMTIFMLSLAGIPPTVGFFAKLFVFQALVTAHLWIPLIVGILTTVISLYYYLRVIVVMVTVPEGAPVERERVGLPMTLVVGLSALGTTLMGLVPQVFGWALQATRF